MCLYLIPQWGPSVVEYTRGTGPDIALYIDLRCVCALRRRSQQPSVSQQSSSGESQKHQTRHNNDRIRQEIITVFKWKPLTDVVRNKTSPILEVQPGVLSNLISFLIQFEKDVLLYQAVINENVLYSFRCYVCFNRFISICKKCPL